MDGVGAVLKALLASDEPSIRWKARVQVLGEDPDAKKIRALREEIRGSSRVKALLSRRDQLGRVGTNRGVYYHWQGLHWVLASLADLGYPEGDESLDPLRDRVLDHWLGRSYFDEYDARTAAQAYRRGGVPRMRGRYRRCASQQGNALYSVTVLGLADARADRLAERLMHWQWPDGGWNCDRHPEAHTSSFTETLLPMVGLAVHARRRADTKTRRAVANAAEVFLERRLFKRKADDSVIQPAFVALHYPPYWHYDILGGLKAMKVVGRIRDARCADALDLLESKRLPDGGWPATKPFFTSVSPRTLKSNADYVRWGATSARRMNEWVTADALSVLRAAGRIDV